MDIDALLHAMRADTIPAGTKGLWTVRKYAIESPRRWKHHILDAGSYTSLHRHTGVTLHRDWGDNVMADYPQELRCHLPCVLRAEGDVLVTGLGLGCVVRGLLARTRTTTITVVERDACVIKLVAPTFDWCLSRVRFVHADALDWAKNTEEPFDWAWHDLWSDPDKEEPHLAILHTELMASLRDRVPRQGAWRYPRALKAKMAKVVGLYG